jgi:hypothetical protein
MTVTNGNPFLSMKGPITGTVSCSGTWKIHAGAFGTTYTGSMGSGGVSSSGTFATPGTPTDMMGTWSGSVQLAIESVIGYRSHSGKTHVVISGSGFRGATSVEFGATPALSFKVAGSSTTIVAVAPPGSGRVDVRVTTPYGTTAITSADELRLYALGKQGKS